jgi:hypothetical protein
MHLFFPRMMWRWCALHSGTAVDCVTQSSICVGFRLRLELCRCHLSRVLNIAWTSGGGGTAESDRL